MMRKPRNVDFRVTLDPLSWTIACCIQMVSRFNTDADTKRILRTVCCYFGYDITKTNG